MALLGLLLKLFPPRAFLHMILTLRDGAEDMANIVFAVYRHWVSRLCHIGVVVVKSGELILFEFTAVDLKRQDVRKQICTYVFSCSMSCEISQ